MHEGYSDQGAERARKAITDQAKAFQKQTPTPDPQPASKRAEKEDNDALRQYAVITGGSLRK